MKREVSRIDRYRIQLAATVLGCISIVKLIREAFWWWDITYVPALEFAYYITLIVGGGVLAVYYRNNRKTLLLKAHVILLVGFIFRFCDIAGQCLFSEDVPGYSIVLFDLLPGFSLLAEIAVLVILKKNKKSEFWKKIILLNSLIQSIFWGLAIVYGILDSFASIHVMIENLSGLYGVTLFVTYINISVDCIKGEIDYLG